MTAPVGAPGPQVVVPGTGWIDAASRVVVQVGFPIVVAAVLLWFLLTRFQTNMDAITSRMADNTRVVTTLIDQEEQSYTELRQQSVELGKQTLLMAAISDNAAKLVAIRTEEAATLKRLEERIK